MKNDMFLDVMYKLCGIAKSLFQSLLLCSQRTVPLNILCFGVNSLFCLWLIVVRISRPRLSHLSVVMFLSQAHVMQLKSPCYHPKPFVDDVTANQGTQWCQCYWNGIKHYQSAVMNAFLSQCLKHSVNFLAYAMAHFQGCFF